jgi:hypothetical protein
LSVSNHGFNGDPAYRPSSRALLVFPAPRITKATAIEHFNKFVQSMFATTPLWTSFLSRIYKPLVWPKFRLQSAIRRLGVSLSTRADIAGQSLTRIA